MTKAYRRRVEKDMRNMSIVDKMTYYSDLYDIVAMQMQKELNRTISDIGGNTKSYSPKE